MHVRGLIVPELSQRPGGDQVTLLDLAKWRPMAVIRAFAGKNVEEAIVENRNAAATSVIILSRRANRRDVHGRRLSCPLPFDADDDALSPEAKSQIRIA